MSKYFSVFVFFIFFGLSQTFGQQFYYFVGFKDKPYYKEIVFSPSLYLSPKAIERRTINGVPLNPNDVPPDTSYINALAKLPLYIHAKSRWFNGCVVLVNNKSIESEIKLLPFVSSVKYLGPANFLSEEKGSREASIKTQLSILEQSFTSRKTATDSIFSGKSHPQISLINADSLLMGEVNGEGVLIAVLDAGFYNLDLIPAFKHLFKEKRIIAAWDLVANEEDVFNDDDHGLAVMSCLAAWQPGKIMGTAPKANYLLLRTENSYSEYLSEEYFWAIAAEYSDSAGADIINSSLGYTKHDEKSMGHKYSELDGKTTIITQAAEIAASKGIIVVASAGNEGDKSWRQISAPADGPNVVAVGAVDKDGQYVGFSSVGPTADKRLKPDLAAMGKNAALIDKNGTIYEGNGTSYACPIVSGTFAQLMQLAPNAGSNKIKEALRLSSLTFYEPDKYIGAGVPNVNLDAKMVKAFGDSIIDIETSEDGKHLLIALNTRRTQKVELKIIHSISGELSSESVTLQKGLNRVAIKINKKRPKGLCRLIVSFGQRSSEVVFML
jgi:hypothetical protein